MVFCRRFVGPARLDAENVGVAGDMDGRIFKAGRVAAELLHGLVEIALLLLVLPGEAAFLPDVGPAFAAADFRRALLEREMIAPWIVFGGRRMIEEATQVDEMFVRRRSFGERDRLPFANEVLRRHRGGVQSNLDNPA